MMKLIQSLLLAFCILTQAVAVEQAAPPKEAELSQDPVSHLRWLGSKKGRSAINNEHHEKHHDKHHHHHKAKHVRTHQASLSKCGDTENLFLVNESIGEQGCVWLRDNLVEFSFMCDLVSTASACPHTCGFCKLFG